MKAVLPTVLQRATFRRQFIQLALKRAHPGTGSSLAFLQQRTWNSAVSILNNILRPDAYLIVGGVATRLYMPERMTLDLDILVLTPTATAIYDQLKQAGARQIGELGIPGSQWELADGTSLDVLVSNEAWVSEAFAHPNYAPDRMPVIGLPYLVLMKLKASRAQDLADISRMLGAANTEARQTVRAVIRKYLPEATEDVESLITLGKLEYETGQ
ncbi:MAG: hypothetical protein AAFQ40_13920 [Cyanobacteria bacterium J06623_5]